jgi:hypothetical protein
MTTERDTTAPRERRAACEQCGTMLTPEAGDRIPSHRVAGTADQRCVGSGRRATVNAELRVATEQEGGPVPSVAPGWIATVSKELNCCANAEGAIVYALSAANMCWERPLDAGRQHVEHIMALAAVLDAHLRGRRDAEQTAVVPAAGVPTAARDRAEGPTDAEFMRVQDAIETAILDAGHRPADLTDLVYVATEAALAGARRDAELERLRDDIDRLRMAAGEDFRMPVEYLVDEVARMFGIQQRAGEFDDHRNPEVRKAVRYILTAEDGGTDR